MPRPKRSEDRPRRESPIQFRPGTDLGQLVTEFSRANRLPDPEACRCLIALAVTGMDGRYYGLIRQFADGLGGAHDFVRACVQVKTMLDGAALAGVRNVLDEPSRSRFILRIVQEALAPKGITVDTNGLWFVDDPHVAPPVTAQTGPRIRRRVRTIHKPDSDTGGERVDDEGGATETPQAQPVRVGR